jgi:2-polyprenyl-3-methyl-5-hydroxy-6-metoxy-1,4-benzoquinol methylase
MPRPEAEVMRSYYKSEEYLSHNSQKHTIKDFLYRQARKFALANKLSMIEKFISPGRVFDFGAGTGEFLNYCKKKGWETLGFEPNDQARKKAIAEYGLQMLGKNQLQQIQQESLDVITLWHVLEHTEDPIKEMKFFHELLKENGLLILALPNYESWDAQHYGQFWAAYDVPRHLYHFSRKSVKKLYERT